MTKLLTKISIENYRAFEGHHTIDLKNLTLFFGYNNTGKSALVRLFPLLSDSVNSSKPTFYTRSYLDYSSPAIRGSLFKELATFGKRRLSFSMKWSDDTSLSFSLQQRGLEAERMVSLEVSEAGTPPKKYEEYAEDFEKLQNKDNGTEIIDFHNFRFENSHTLNELLETYSNSVFWMSATRIHPPRQFEVGMGVKLKIEHDGSGVGPVIWSLAERSSPSLEDINNWLEETCGRKLTFNMDLGSRDGRKTVSLETANEQLEGSDSLRTPILDSGEGITQALPVVTLCAMAANGELGSSPIVVVEQPELHLHPQATVSLAKFLISCVKKNPNVRYVLETHSESFLRAIQIALVQDELKIDDFSCYWISKNEQQSRLTPVDFDEQGFITSVWPAGVFRETINQAKELVQLRNNKGMQ